MFFKKLFPKILLLGLSFFVSHFANAELTQVSVLITQDNNDCNGYFDDPNPVYNGFSSCRITMEDSNGDSHTLSDVIIKFDQEGAAPEISTQYLDPVEKVLASDFDFTFDNTPNGSGSWEYNDGVYKYPDIRFWTAKAAGGGNSGGGFGLFWMVNNIDTTTCTAGENANNLTFACMNLAQSVTTGAWTTPKDKDLSHITFFGGLCTEAEIANSLNGCAGTPPPTPPANVPEPTSIALFALALLGVAARRNNFTF
jgi:hypothetical protein